MFEIAVKSHFDSAHFLRGYEGKCSNLHGHRWEVEAVVSGEKTDNCGMLMDFSILKKLLEKIVDQLDHRNICEIPPFDEINPTAEQLARYIYLSLRSALDETPGGKRCRLEKVTVWESPDCRASYREESPRREGLQA